MATLIRIFAVVSSSLILIGFPTFAADEAGRGSAAQVEAVEDPAGEKKRERKSGPLREVVEDANDVLLAPFDGVTDSRNAWLRRLIPTALGLLLYGFGLMLLANYLPRRRSAKQDWRAA